MATVVKHKPTGKRFLFLGAGFGAYKTNRPGLIFGSLGSEEEEGELTMVAVCDREGNILWTNSDDLTVVEIDGRPPKELLPDD